MCQIIFMTLQFRFCEESRVSRRLYVQKLAVSNFYMNISPLSSVNQFIFYLPNTVPLQKYFSGTGVVRSEKSQFLTLKLNATVLVENKLDTTRRTNQISVEILGQICAPCATLSDDRNIK
jgi:hypothetical protein